MDDKKHILISVIVVAYNPNWKKMKTTLESIISQKKIEFEIVVADDGSEKNLKTEIVSYFKEKDFNRFHLINNKNNQGTVSNLLSGLEICRGKWVKAISPGDYLIDDLCLQDWVSYCENNRIRWSFSDAIYYKNTPNGMKALSCKMHPCDLSPYIKKDFDKCRWNYVVLDDIALGSTMVCETEILLGYLKKIHKKVIYAEDNVWRLMMYDGIPMKYYPKETVLYEFGEGVSTSNSKIWRGKIKKDWDITTELILAESSTDDIQKKIKKGIKQNSKIIIKKFISGKIRLRIKKRFAPRMSKNYLPEKYLHASD